MRTHNGSCKRRLWRCRFKSRTNKNEVGKSLGGMRGVKQLTLPKLCLTRAFWHCFDMIDVHRPNGQPFVVNVLHIVTVESTPDTLLTLYGGDKLRVVETPEQIITRSRAFLAHLGALAQPDESCDAMAYGQGN